MGMLLLLRSHPKPSQHNQSISVYMFILWQSEPSQLDQSISVYTHTCSIGCSHTPNLLNWISPSLDTHIHVSLIAVTPLTFSAGSVYHWIHIHVPLIAVTPITISTGSVYLWIHTCSIGCSQTPNLLNWMSLFLYMHGRGPFVAVTPITFLTGSVYLSIYMDMFFLWQSHL